jgi:Bacterial Ig domain
MDLAARKTVVWGALLALVCGCNGRDRLTFPTSSDGLGPEATITDPSQDTTVSVGPNALVSGVVADGDGIDTVYFNVVGGVTTFSPFIAHGMDTVTFQLPLTTNGLSGNTITVSVYGVNVAGLVGDTAVRNITVQ